MLDGRLGSRLAGQKYWRGSGIGLLTSWAAISDCDCIAAGPMNTDALLDNAIPLSPRPNLGGTGGDMKGV